MTQLFCQEHPEILTLTGAIWDIRPGAVLLSQHPFYPGGGGQLPDRGRIQWSGGEADVTGFTKDRDGIWISHTSPVDLSGDVLSTVDANFRQTMRELHTDLHILNALVYRDFDGALVTGAQMEADGTARIDFDLPEVENDRLRALDSELNDIVRQNLPVRIRHVSLAEAQSGCGLLRSRSVAPPPSADGMVRIVDIVGLDQQACGGTHLSFTGASRPIRILKIENKGRSNRRVRIGLQER